MIRPSTFSIVARDAAENAWGVAVASKFLAVGAVVPFAAAGVGAIATQSLANLSYGEDGLRLLAEGESAPQVLARLTAADAQREQRQAGIVDAQGRAATFTGRECMNWAGGLTGDGWAIQGNILAGEGVVQAMAQAYAAAAGELADRLVAALAAGDAAGGDRRGRQSACVLVVRPHGSYGGFTDRYLDLRVDDHPTPVTELARLLRLHHLFLGESKPEERLPITPELAAELQALFRRLGYYTGEVNGRWDTATQQAAGRFVGVENLEERVDVARGTIDPPALAYVRERWGE